MSHKPSALPPQALAEKLVRDIRRATHNHHSAEDKLRIVLEGPAFDLSVEYIEK